jgi:hypothetical protein
MFNCYILHLTISVSHKMSLTIYRLISFHDIFCEKRYVCEDSLFKFWANRNFITIKTSWNTDE